MIQGGEIDRLTDMFAAGVTLFRSVNNMKDWHGVANSAGNLNANLQAGTLIQKIGYSAEVPTKLRTIINRAGAAAAINRFESCSAFRQALEKLYFENSWTQLSEDEWISDVPGRRETLTLHRGSRYVVEHRINGRRRKENCVTVATAREAAEHMYALLKRTTIS